LAPLIPAKIVKVLEWLNVECAKEKALCSKNMMDILVNNGLVLIPFRKSADDYFNISSYPAGFVNPKC